MTVAQHHETMRRGASMTKKNEPSEKEKAAKQPEQDGLTEEQLDGVAGGMLACAPPTTTNPEPVVIQGGTYLPKTGGG
jgi:hypothetical protein